jgi:quinol monooxygenase YgiN
MSIVIVMGFLRVRDGDVSRLKSAIEDLTVAAGAQDGCEHYSVSVDVSDPLMLRVSERWRDRAAQSLHMVGDHMVTFNLAMRRGKVTEAKVDAFDSDGTIRKLLYI